MKNVTVYCSSSKRVDPYYLDMAELLGRSIAERGWRLVYGGNTTGCMGRLADGARAAGGKVTGVCPKVFSKKGNIDLKCEELIVTEDMSERKQILQDRANAFVVFPGGIGTIDELVQVLTEKHIGIHDKPIVLVNLKGYYEPFLAMMREQISGGFTREKILGEMIVAGTVEEALEAVG